MKAIDIIHSHNPKEISASDVRIEPISESLMGKVKNLIVRTNPGNRDISVDNTFVLSVPINNSVSVVGVVCIEPNDVRTKYEIQSEEAVGSNNHEITYVLIDDRLLNKEALIFLLRRLFSMCVSAEPIDEIFWLSQDDRLHALRINQVFKAYNYEYYFINEARYFANALLTICGKHADREKYTIIEGWKPTELEKSLMDGSFDQTLCESDIQSIPEDLLNVQTFEDAMADLKREVEQWP